MSVEIVCNLQSLTSNDSYLLYIGDNFALNHQSYSIIPRPLNSEKQILCFMQPNYQSELFKYSVSAPHEFRGECHIVIRVAKDGNTMDVFLNGVLYDELNGNAISSNSNINSSDPMIRKIPQEISIGKSPTSYEKNLGYANGGGATISYFRMCHFCFCDFVVVVVVSS